MNYKSFPIQNIINSGNIENSLNRIVQMQKMSGIGLIEPSTVTTPPHIVDEILEALPKEIWIHTTRFLNIACKDGIFLVKIFQRLMQSDELKEYESDETKRAWHILENQLYAICVDEPIGRMLSTLLYGMSGLSSSHITWFNTLKDLQKLSDDALRQYIYSRFRATGQIEKSEVNKYMQFDVVIGNPPYNKGMDLDFVDLGFDLANKYEAMIVPAKWQTAANDYSGCTSNFDYEVFRERFVPHINHLCFYPCCKDVFDILQVDGITWFIADKNKKYSKCTVENKCQYIHSFNSIEERDISYRATLFNIGNEIVQYLGNYNKFDFGIATGKRYQVYTNTQVPGGGLSTMIAPRKTQFVGVSEVIDRKSLKGTTSGTCALSFESELLSECENFISWLNTRFTRFFVAINISKLTGIISNDYFRFVPEPLLKEDGSYDWSIRYTDELLYKHYNLPQKYIDVIEAVVKERK